MFEPLRVTITEQGYSGVRIKRSMNQGNPHSWIIN